MNLKSMVLDYTKERSNEDPTNVKGLSVYRLEAPYERTSIISMPVICFIIQGQKSVYIGGKKIDYNEENYLISSAKMPVESELETASPQNPYLGIVIDLDEKIIADLLREMDEFVLWEDKQTTNRIITESPIDNNIQKSLIRLVEILDDPVKSKVLGKSIIREIFFYILLGENGHVLRNSIINHAKANKIVPVIQFLEKNFKNNVEIQELVHFSGMSSTSLHENFKKATALSPMQFLKRLRLHHAHDLIIAGENAGNAAFESGYGNQSQFTREFKRHFGFLPSNIKT